MRHFIAVLALSCAVPAAAHPAPVIPNPAEVLPGSGGFALSAATPLWVSADDAGALAAAERFIELVRRSHGLSLAISRAPTRQPAIEFRRGPAGPAESYTLEVGRAAVSIVAPDEAGLYYGAVTLWQLLPLDAPTVAAVTIRDRPAFRWRGLMLDSARHYQSPAFIREFLDWMAIHKLNVLHWHLTDDQGWRLEIRRYPRLTEVGAWRVPAGRAAHADLDSATGAPRRYGGYYSQATVRELVAYAAARHITIVPEIDMPGHAAAAIAAYPELGVAPVRLAEVPADWGIYPYVFNVSEPTCVFLEQVLEEVLELFPGRYIHLGGDEVVAGEWQNSSEVAARALTLGLESPKALHRYLVQRLASFVEARGRRLVGWDEILEPGLPTSAVVMSWRGVEGALAASARGHEVVLSPWPTLYFDFAQSDALDEPPGRGRLTTLSDVYHFDPLPGALKDDASRLLGVQANIWTEHIRTEPRVAHMSFPRAAALAELGWSSPARREWPDFLERLAALSGRYRRLGLPFADSDFAVRALAHYDLAAGSARIELASSAGVGTIHYSIDGREPGPGSPLYREPLTLALTAELKANTFLGRTPLAAPRGWRFSPSLARHRASRELALCGDKLPLVLEDDAPLAGPRAEFYVDLMQPCWRYLQVDLSGVTTVAAAVGQVPFNFQIGADRDQIVLPKPSTAAGELEVRLDRCDGALLARLPLESAARNDGVTELEARFPATAGIHDLCLQFAAPAIDPLYDQALGESDLVKRSNLVKQIQRIVWDDAPYLFCVHGLNVRGLSPKVQGFINSKEWQFQFQTIYKT